MTHISLKLENKKECLEMSFINKVKNTFTKGKFVEFTGNNTDAIDDLVKQLKALQSELKNGVNLIGGVVIVPTGSANTNVSNEEEYYYKKHYICRGLKSQQIDELFKYRIINGVINKGGTLGGFRTWSKGIYSKLKSIISKSRSKIEKIEKIRDSNRKEHWQKFYDIGIEAYGELKEIFEPNNHFNQKFIKNERSRLHSENVERALNELSEKMGEFSLEFSKDRIKLANINFSSGEIVFSTNDKFRSTGEQAINNLVQAINSFKENFVKLSPYLSGVVVCASSHTNMDSNFFKGNYLKRGPKSCRTEENFKKFITNGVIDIGNRFGGFRSWSDDIYSKLKSITSDAHSEIAKIEKINGLKYREKHWEEFYKIERTTLKKIREVFDLNNNSNKKFTENKTSRLLADKVKEALKSLETAIDEKIKFIEQKNKELKKAYYKPPLPIRPTR